jgi:hypothetical protein
VYKQHLYMINDLNTIYISSYHLFKKHAPKFLLWMRLGWRERSHRRKEMFEAINNLRMIPVKSR